MKKLLIIAQLLIATTVYSQNNNLNETKVRVQIKGEEDSFEFISVIDLLGSWKNINTGSPILNSKIPQGSIVIRSGSMLDIKDSWSDDYSNKLRNCKWIISNTELKFSAPDSGNLPVILEKRKDSNLYDLTVNSITYRKLVNRSVKN